MGKKDAIKIFGSQAAMARALGLSPAAVCQWPDLLTQKQADWVTGAAVRLGLIVAPRVREDAA